MSERLKKEVIEAWETVGSCIENDVPILKEELIQLISELRDVAVNEAREVKAGDVVTLKGISRHGKNRISEQGARWVVSGVGRKGAGHPGFVLLEKDNGLDFWRWVALADDKNFIMELEG